MANGVLLVRSQVPLSLWARFSDEDQDPPTTRAEFVDSSEVIICVEEEFSRAMYRDGSISWALGCVNSRLVARGSQEAGFTQPRAHLTAHLCSSK